MLADLVVGVTLSAGRLYTEDGSFLQDSSGVTLNVDREICQSTLLKSLPVEQLNGLPDVASSTSDDHVPFGFYINQYFVLL
jgi:hypothetical protein